MAITSKRFTYTKLRSNVSLSVRAQVSARAGEQGKVPLLLYLTNPTASEALDRNALNNRLMLFGRAIAQMLMARQTLPRHSKM